MPQQNAPWYGTPTSARMFTTLIAGGWGVSSAYILFRSLLITHDAGPCLAAFVPLVVVWATLERKRWGRLALLGLSATALGLFVAAVGFIAAVGNNFLQPAERNVANYAQIAMRLYSDNPATTFTTLILAATTGLWLRRPVVVAEFERGKRANMATAQLAIASSLVGCWGVIVVLTSMTTAGQNKEIKSSRAQKAAHGRHNSGGASYKGSSSRKRSKYPSRSAASANNL